MKRLAIILSCVLLIACATTNTTKFLPSAKLPLAPLCRHKVIYATAMLVEIWDTTIAWGKVGNVDHVQTIVRIDGESHWVDVKDGSIYFVEKDKDFKVMSYMSPSEYMTWYSKFIVNHKDVRWKD